MATWRSKGTIGLLGIRNGMYRKGQKQGKDTKAEEGIDQSGT